MYSTAAEVMKSIVSNTSFPISMEQIRFGYSKLPEVTSTTPWVYLSDFKTVFEYDTGGLTKGTSTFILTFIATSLETAETLAQAIDTYFNLSAPTPRASMITTESYELQCLPTDEKDYRYAVVINYTLEEDLA